MGFINNKRLREVLEGDIEFPDQISVDSAYEAVQDDDDGTGEGKIIVMFSKDGDAWVTTDKHRGPALRFRGEFGGGRSLRVRNALVILALAVALDQKG